MLKVLDVMDVYAVAVREETSLYEIYNLVRQYNMWEFPVVSQDYQLLGMVYENDILRALFPQDTRYVQTSIVQDTARLSRRISVKQLMKRGVPQIEPNFDLIQVGNLMAWEGLRNLPVVENGKYVGMLHQSKVFLALMTRYSEKGAVLDVISPKVEGSVKDAAKVIAIHQYVGRERRRHKRMHVRLTVAFKLADITLPAEKRKPGVATALNVSVGGMLLQTEEPLKDSSLVDLAFDLSTQNQPIKRLGRVLRCQHDVVTNTYRSGIMFLAMNSSERSEIEKFLYES